MSPYIKKKDREKLDPIFQYFIIEHPGELNYVITKLIVKYLCHKVGNTPHKLCANYTDYNEVMGVLECVKLELYRKVISKYEDKKCELNGEVYD